MNLDDLTESTLAEVCSLVTDGTHDTPKRVTSGYPLIKAKEIVGGRIDFESCDQISETEHRKVIARSKPEFGDTLFTHIGASLGEAAFVNTSREFSIKNIALFKPNPAVIAPRYLYYLVISPTFQDSAKGTKTGSAQPFLGLSQLRGHAIQYHRDLSTQRRIAGILSTYDELIENNQRRTRILEEMARSLYREWFVHFRYPGHESVPLVDSPLGQIPQGWAVKKLGEVLELNYGKALKKEDRQDGEFPVYGSSGVIGHHDTLLVKGPGVIVGRKGNVGSVFWSDEDFFVIDTAYFVTARLPLRFVFYDLKTKNFINSDAAVPGLSRHQAYSLETVVPPASLLARFCQLAEGFEQQASVLRKQTANLRRTRDLLLPRLLSGNLKLECDEEEVLA